MSCTTLLTWSVSLAYLAVGLQEYDNNDHLRSLHVLLRSRVLEERSCTLKGEIIEHVFGLMSVDEFIRVG